MQVSDCCYDEDQESKLSSWFHFTELDRKCFNASAELGKLACWSKEGFFWLFEPLTTKQLDPTTSLTQEVGQRILFAVKTFFGLLFTGMFTVPAVVGLGILSKIFRQVGFYFQKDKFTYVPGDAPEQELENGRVNIMAWRIRGDEEGLYKKMGVEHWRNRVDGIIDSIRKENQNGKSLEVAVLPDVEDPALMEKLIAGLRDQYSHFYIHCRCMVMTKCPVDYFSHTDFHAQDGKIQRGFIILETASKNKGPVIRIVGTDLSPGEEAEELRESQLDQIINALAKRRLAMATMLVGSFGANRDNMKESLRLLKYVFHSYLGAEPNRIDLRQWAPIYEGVKEVTDEISLVKRNPPNGKILPVIEKDVRVIDVHLGDGFDSKPLPLSDCKSVIGQYGGLRSALHVSTGG